MKLYGDVPESHKILVAELNSLENWFKINGDEVPLLSAAKGFTCMAHDWFSIGVEEEGERLLKGAESLCPGYFKGPILSQITRDMSFAYLVGRLTEDEIAVDVMRSLGFEL